VFVSTGFDDVSADIGNLRISGRNILPMTIPLDASGLNFQVELGPPAHFIV
jgi:hypothetical protein